MKNNKRGEIVSLVFLIILINACRRVYARARWRRFSVEINFFQKKEKNLKNFKKMLDIILG